MNYEEAKDNLNNKFLLCPIDCAEDCEVCRIEAVQLAIKALEKQIPKKPIEDTEYVGWLIWRCPVCGQEVGRVLEPLQHHCECGQAIDCEVE